VAFDLVSRDFGSTLLIRIRINSASRDKSAMRFLAMANDRLALRPLVVGDPLSSASLFLLSEPCGSFLGKRIDHVGPRETKLAQVPDARHRLRFRWHIACADASRKQLSGSKVGSWVHPFIGARRPCFPEENSLNAPPTETDNAAYNQQAKFTDPESAHFSFGLALRARACCAEKIRTRGSLMSTPKLDSPVAWIS